MKNVKTLLLSFAALSALLLTFSCSVDSNDQIDPDPNKAVSNLILNIPIDTVDVRIDWVQNTTEAEKQVVRLFYRDLGYMLGRAKFCPDGSEYWEVNEDCQRCKPQVDPENESDDVRRVSIDYSCI